MMNSLILVAAGQGTRMGHSINKLLMEANGHPLIWYTLKNILESHCLEELVIVVREDEERIFKNIVSSLFPKISVKWARGGLTRMESVANGLCEVSHNSDKLLIHDGARPFVDGVAIDKIYERLDSRHPAVIFALPCIDTIKEAADSLILKTLDRSKLYRAQTPQGVLTPVYRKVLQEQPKAQLVTDDASLLEAAGIPVTIIPGSEKYFKLTTQEDWNDFIQMIKPDSTSIRIGQGYDIHRFAESRPLYLGGVKLSNTGGLLGHSDADVLIHAIMDALLGAAGLPDIGHFFPDTDERYEGASSLELLKQVHTFISDKRYKIGNIDSTVIAEKPKIAGYIDQMKTVLATVLQVLPDQINIKATTNEKLGAVGRKEGIAAMASVLLFRR